MTTSNSSYRGSDAPLWPLRHIHTQIETFKILISKNVPSIWLHCSDLCSFIWENHVHGHVTCHDPWAESFFLSLILCLAAWLALANSSWVHAAHTRSSSRSIGGSCFHHLPWTLPVLHDQLPIHARSLFQRIRIVANL